MRIRSNDPDQRLDVFPANKTEGEGVLMVTEWAWGRVEGTMTFSMDEAGKLRDWLDEYLEAKSKALFLNPTPKAEDPS